MNTDKQTETAARCAACEAAEQELKKAQQPQHSPLPFTYDTGAVRDANGDVVAEVWNGDGLLIVRAVNHADKLAEALREIARKIDRDNLNGRYITSATREALAAYEENHQ